MIQAIKITGDMLNCYKREEFMDYLERLEKAPKLKDLENNPKFNVIIEQALQKWKGYCDSAYEKHGDAGPCIIGEGIEIMVKPPRCRKGRYKRFLYPPTSYQGEAVRLSGVEEVAQFIREQMPEIEDFVNVNYGRLD